MNSYHDGHVDILSAGFEKWSVYIMEESTVLVGGVGSIALQEPACCVHVMEQCVG